MQAPAPEHVALQHPHHRLLRGCHRGGAGAVVHEGHLAKGVAAPLHVDPDVHALAPLQHLKLAALHHVQLAGAQPWERRASEMQSSKLVPKELSGKGL